MKNRKELEDRMNSWDEYYISNIQSTFNIYSEYSGVEFYLDFQDLINKKFHDKDFDFLQKLEILSRKIWYL